MAWFKISLLVMMSVMLVPTSATSQDVEWSMFSNEEFGWSIEYPKDWSVDFEEKHFVTFTRQNPSIYCGVHSATVPVTSPEDLIHLLRGFYVARLQEIGTHIVETEWSFHSASSGQFGILTTTELLPGGRSLKLYFVENGIGFVVDCEAPLDVWDDVSERIEKLISSFRFSWAVDHQGFVRGHLDQLGSSDQATLSRGIDAYYAKDYPLALSELEPLAQQGVAAAQFYVGEMYSFGRGVEEDFAEAAHWFQLAADQGDPFAQHGLGWLYRFGDGVDQSDDEAERWFQSSAKGLALLAEEGNSRAAYDMGSMAEYGQGMPRNALKAIAYYELSLRLDRKTEWAPLCAANIAELYKGSDSVRTFRWMLTASELGHAYSQFEVGEMYANGVGVQEDDRQAIIWFQEAGAQNPRLDYEFARLLETGEGLKSDPAAALTHYHSSARNGYVDAQFRLGVLYSEGKGTNRNPSAAYFWFLVSQENGLQSGRLAAEKIRPHIPTELVEKVQLDAELCVQSDYEFCGEF